MTLRVLNMLNQYLDKGRLRGIPVEHVNAHGVEVITTDT